MTFQHTGNFGFIFHTIFTGKDSRHNDLSQPVCPRMFTFLLSEKILNTLLDTTISFLMGETENQYVFKDPVMFKRMAEIESLPQRNKECLLLTVDNFIKATKLNML